MRSRGENLGEGVTNALPLDLVLHNLNIISILLIRILEEKSTMKQTDFNKLGS